LSSQPDDFAKYVVPIVIDKYQFRYEKRYLSKHQQRSVAASVFHVLEKSKKAVYEVPELQGLTGDEKAIAESFLQYDKIEYGRKTISVTPAQELVLFKMTGIPSRLIARLKTEELLAAFYVVRQSLFHRMEQFGELGESFAELWFYSLQEQMKDKREHCVYHYVPMAEVGPTVVRGDAPLAVLLRRTLLLYFKPGEHQAICRWK
jgi:hypothetical protein